MKFFKEAKVDWKPIMKDFIGPGLVIGGAIGAGTYAVTKEKDQKGMGNWAKAIGAGIAGDAVTGLGMGLWQQRKTLLKAASVTNGDVVRITNKDGKYFKAEGVVVGINGNKSKILITNTGENYQPGSSITEKSKYLNRIM